MKKSLIFCLLTLLPAVAFGEKKCDGDFNCGFASRCTSAPTGGSYKVCVPSCEDIESGLNEKTNWIQMNTFMDDATLEESDCMGAVGSNGEKSCDFYCYYDDDTKKRIHVCARGAYSNSDRSVACKTCPKFSGAPASTVYTGATSITQCLGVITDSVKQNTYTDETGTFQIVSEESGPYEYSGTDADGNSYTFRPCFYEE